MNADPRPLTVLDLLAMKAAGRRIVMLTCYDAVFARLLEQAGVDVLLVGDSLNQVLAGHETTLSTTLDQMIYHAAAVRRGSRRALVFVDLPFLTYQISIPEAIRNAGRVLRRAGAHGVKLEGGGHMAETVASAGGARHSGDRASRSDPAVGPRPGRLPGAGQGRERSRAAAGGRQGAGGRGGLRHRLGADPGRAGWPDLRSPSPFPRSASAPGPRCDGQVWSCTTCWDSTSSSPRNFSSTTPSWASRCGTAVRKFAVGGPGAEVSGQGAQL